MRKLGWYAVSAAVGAMIVFGVLLLAANLYVQSQGAQERIRQTLTDALHVPVTLEKTTLTPWEGLRIDGIKLKSPLTSSNGTAAIAPLMTAESFRLRAAWWPLLLHRQVVADAVLLERPQLVWAQNQEGRWVWPQSPSAQRRRNAPVSPSPELPEGDSPPIPESPTPVASVAASPVGPAAAATNPDSRAGAGEPPDTAVRKFRVRHGALDLLNERQKLLGRFEEVNLDGQLRDAGHASGRFRVQRATHARSGLNLTNFSSGFTYDAAEGLTIDQGRGELAGGKVMANYRLRTQEPGSPFSADCQIMNVDLSRLIQEAGSQLRLMEGRLQGGVSFQGVSDDPERRHAAGQLQLVGAQVRNFPILQLMGDILHIEDLSHLQFKKAELNCQLEADDLLIAPLNLASNNLQIVAQGRYSTRADRLDLHGRMTIDQAISHQLPQFIEMNFTPCGDEAPGSRYIDFDVNGPLNKPNTNLFDRVLAGPTNGLLQNLLAPKPKKPRLKGSKPDGQSVPPAAPADPGNF